MSVSLGVSASICTDLSCWPLEAMKALYMDSLLQPLQLVWVSPFPLPGLPMGSGAMMEAALGMTPIWVSTEPLNSRSTCAFAAKEIPKTDATATARIFTGQWNGFKQTPVGRRKVARHNKFRPIIESCPCFYIFFSKSKFFILWCDLNKWLRRNNPCALDNILRVHSLNHILLIKSLGAWRCAPHEHAANLFIAAAQVVQVPGLHFLARPWSLAQKRQAGFYAWVACETAHVNSLRQSFPTVALHQDCQDGFKSHALKWIVRMLGHCMWK